MTLDQDAMQKRYHNGYVAGERHGRKTGYREGYEAGYRAAIVEIGQSLAQLPTEARRAHRRAIGRAS